MVIYIGSIFDSVKNAVANLATARDKSSFSEYFFQPLTRQQLVNAYRGSWLPRKIVDIPAKDATRRWRTWSATREQITEIERIEKKFRVQDKVRNAKILARLTGRSALYFGTKDTNVTKEFDAESVSKDGLLYVSLLNEDHFSATELDNDVASSNYGKPKAYNLSMSDMGLVSEVHPSRLAVFGGATVSDERLFGKVGEGESVLQSTYDALIKCDATTANIASLLFEAKIDVINIPGLMKNLNDKKYEKDLLERFSFAGLAKGNNGMLILDEKETYTQKTMHFAALSDLMDRFAQNVCGAADIPMTRLFGRSPGGENSTGESDLRNYYDMIQDMQENEIDPAMSVLNEVILRSALGSRDPEIFPTWPSLWQLTEMQRAELMTKTVTAISTMVATKLLPTETMQAAATNMLIESESWPGLESAIEEFGLEKSDEELEAEFIREVGASKNEVDIRERAGEKALKQPTEKPAAKKPAKDATPRTLYVRRDVLNGAEIVRWAKSQGFKTTLPAADMHVTVCFSKTPVDWMAVGDDWEPKLEVQGGPRLMEKFGEASVLLFSSRSLKWRNEEFKHAGATSEHSEYQPHVTISYSSDGPDLSAVAPYTGKIVLGPEIFEEISDKWRSTIKEV